MSIIKRFGVDFNYPEGGGYSALTLPQNSVCECFLSEEEVRDDIIYSRTHSSGWTISGKLHTDWFIWVNEFKATHPLYGRVWGNFHADVKADSEEGFAHFYRNHEPYAWDYGDI